MIKEIVVGDGFWLNISQSLWEGHMSTFEEKKKFRTASPFSRV